MTASLHRAMTAADIGLIAGNIAEVAPHATYCDVALGDAYFSGYINGEPIGFFDDDLFDTSLAGNGYKVVPLSAFGTSLIARVRDLEAALKPFVALANEIDAMSKETGIPREGWARVCWWEDLERARVALGEADHD